MLHIEHLNLVVKDISQSLKFYQAAFPHWRVRGGGKHDWYGLNREWIHFGDDFQYLALNGSGKGSNRDLKGHDVGLAHMAFVTSEIDAITKRLVDAGFEISNEGGKDESRANIYFIDPDGYEVEFVEYFTDQPRLRNQY